MSDQFNIAEYLRTKISPSTDKVERIELAKQQKLEKLRAFSEGMRANSAAILAREEAQRQSLAGQLGLDRDGYVAPVVNTVLATANEIVNLPGQAMAAVVDQNAETYPEWDSRRDNLKQTAQQLRTALDFSSTVGINPDTGQHQSGLGERVVKDGAIALANSAISVPQMAVGLASLVSGGHAGKYLEEAGFRPEEAKQFLETLKSHEAQAASREVQGAEGFWGTLSAIADNPTVVPAAVLESLFPMLAGGLVGRGLQALGTVAKIGMSGTMAAAAGEGIIMAGGAAENIRNQTADGLLTPEQMLAAATTGVAGAAVSRVSGGTANKLGIGDIDEAVVKGTLGQSKRGATTRTVGGGAFEGGEELLQSSAEKSLENVALERPYDQGVGNAAAMGLVTGMAMGAPMGLAQHVGDQAAEKVKQQSTFKTAMESGDVAVYTDPTNRDYNPTRAVAALYGNSKQEGVTQEAKEANLEKANEIIVQLEARHEAMAKDTALYAPKALVESKRQLAQMEADLAKTNPADKAKVEYLTSAIADMKEGIAESAGDAKKFEKKSKELQALNQQLEGAIGNRAQLERLVNGTEEVDANAAVEAADIKLDPADEATSKSASKAIDQVIKLSMAAPDKLTPEMIDRLVNNTENSLTGQQRKYLRQFSEAKAAENELKTMGDVTDEVINGTPDGKNIGLRQYRERIGTALKRSDMPKATKLLDLLGNFADSHKGKIVAVTKGLAAYEADRIQRRVERNTDGTWSIQEGFFKDEKERSLNGGLNLNSRKLAERIGKEAKTIAKLHVAMTEAIALKSSRPVQKAPAPVAPSTTPAATATASPTQAAPVVSEAPTPKPKAAKPTPQEKDLKKAIREQRKVIRNNPVSLWTKLKNSMNDVDLNEIYGSEWKKRYTSLKNKDGGRSIVDMVADGLLDEFLPPKMRSSVNDGVTNPAWETEAEEHIKEMMRSGNYLTYDTQMEAKAVGLKIQDLEQEIASGQLTKEEIENELADIEASETEQTTEDQTVTDTGNVEATEAEQSSTEGNPDAVATEDGEPATDIVETPNGALEALQDKSEETNNWLAQQVTQKAGNPDTGTVRPLVAVKNFLTSALKKETGIKFTDYLSSKELDDKQKAAIKLLRDASQAWFPKITASLVRGYFAKKDKDGNVINAKKENPNFAYADLTQFLLQGQNDKDLDLEENVKTAIVYAALRAIADMASNRYNDDDMINIILGAKPGSYVDPDIRALLSEGQRENYWRNSIGQAVVQALGITATDETSGDLIPRLETAMGAHVEKLLVGTGVLKRKVFTAEEMALVGRPFTNEDGKSVDENGELLRNEKGNLLSGQAWIMLSLAREANGELRPTANSVVEDMKGSKNILDKLFGVESAVRQPTLEPVEFKQKNAAKAQEGIPSDIKEAVMIKQQEKNYMRDDIWRVVSNLDSDVFLQMAGMTPEEQIVHKANELSVKAKNEGLVREYNHFMSFVQDTLKTANEVLGNVPFFYQYSVKRQQRVHIDNNGFNPQASKMHRYLTYRDSWKLDIDFTDTPMVDNFLLRFAESMGVKTDAKMNAYTLQHIAQLYDPEANGHTEESRIKAEKVAAGIMVLQKLQESDNTVTLTDEEQEQLRKAVEVGGEKIHSLAGLIEITKYLTAKANGEKSFTTYMQGEVDGKTNGPMLSQILFGGAIDIEDMKQRLRRGGFYFKGDSVTQFNEYRSQGGNDQYEAIASAIVRRVREALAQGKNRAQLEAIEFFLKDLEKNNEILKAGRELVKNPMTTIMFGSTMYSAVDKMADRLLDRIYATIEEVGSKTHKADLKTTMRHLNALLSESGYVFEASNIQEALSTKLSQAQIKGIKKSFHSSFGRIAQNAMEAELADYLKNRDLVNNTANNIFTLSNALITVIREQYITELNTAQKIKERNGKPIADLTKAQQRELDKRIDALVPRIHTVGSRRDGNAKNGVRIGKIAKQMSTNPVYKSVIQFGTPVSSQDNTYTFTATATESYLKSPRTGTNSKQIHSLDSDISHTVQKALEVLNVHDALLGGLKNFTEMGQRLNEATWNSIVEYSPISEIRDTLISMVYGINNTISDKNVQLTEEFKQTLAIELDGVEGAINRLNEAAYKSDKLKLETMLEMASVDQYTLEGGAFTPTAEHYADVQQRLDNLSPELPLEVYQAVDTLKELSKEFAPKHFGRGGKKISDSPFGTVLNNVEGNTRMEGAISKRGGKLTSVQAVNMLRQLFPANTVNREILEKVAPLLSEGLTVNLITGKSQESDVLAMPNGPSSAWYVSKEGTEAIYMLSGSFNEANMTPEVLLHELVHAATAQTIRNPSKEAKALIAELETLRSEAKAVVESDASLNQYLPAVESLDELISWGMTNKGFQVKVLTKVRMETKTQGNPLITGLKAFIETISKLLFRNPTKQQTNGMTILVTNVAGLLTPEAKAQGTLQDVNQSMSVVGMSTLDIHNALNDGTTSPAFDAHLQSLLSGIVNSIHGPWGTLKDMVEKTKAQTPQEAFHEAEATGVIPFTSDALKGGFRISAQESFAIDQVEATVRAALEGNEGQLYAASSELTRLYGEAYNKLKTQDFSKDPQKQALFDFVFSVQSRKDGRSEFLSRFAALGLAHQEFRTMLEFATDRDTRTLDDIKGIPAKILFVFNKIMNFFNSKVTHTYSGQSADSKLDTLVNQLVNIEIKRKQMLELQTKVDVQSKIEELFREGSDKLRKKMGDFGDSAFFQSSSNEFVKLAGNALSIVGHDRADQMINTLIKFRDSMIKDKQGVLAGMLTEVRGAPTIFQGMLRAVKLHEKTRKNVMTWVAKSVSESFANEKMSEADKRAVTYTFLRTDAAALLESMTMEDLMATMSNDKKLETNIKDLEQQLVNQFPLYAVGMMQQSADLAYHMVTNENVSEHLLLNAGNIANMYGTVHAKKLTAAEVATATGIIDKLVSLRAIQYVDATEKKTAMAIFKEEMGRQGGANGITMLLNTHLKLQKDSRERLFSGSEALMMKGYLPEITDQSIDVRVVDDTLSKDLIDKGYKNLGAVSTDPKDYNQDARSLHILKDGGLNPHTTGIFSLTNLRRRGSEVFLASNTHQKKVMARVRMVTNRMYSATTIVDPRTVKARYAVPVLNANGKITDYRYEMSAQTRDAALRRDNRFDTLLGAMAGATLDKEVSAKQNAQAVQALKDFYEADLSEHPDSYFRVGPTSTDPELKEIWDMLPDATKAVALEVWGADGMMVRNDTLSLNFGYRKISIADLWDDKAPNIVEHWTMKLVEAGLYFYARQFEHLNMDESERYKKRAANVARRAERMWQEVVHEMKDIIVMKTGTVMLGNIFSNISLLRASGISFAEIVKTHRIAIAGAVKYQQDQEELYRLELTFDGTDAKVAREISLLKDSLSKNPVRVLMEAGLMPSIVEDVAAEEDIYSYKQELVQAMDKYTSKLNPTVVKVARFAYMAHDTKLYRWLNQTTQLSDFVARYTLYQHLTTKKDAMSSADAIQEASDSFINYDIPSHRTLQYLDDMGILMFTKYFLRIQKVLLKLAREHPTRVLGMLMFDHFFNLGPVVMESSFVSHFGNNPIRSGALNFPSVLDDIAVVEAGLKIIR